MDLHIYTPELEYVGVIDTATSIRWRAQIFDTGEIELHAAADDQNRELAVDNYIALRADEPTEFAVFEGIEIDDTDDEEGAKLAITGRLGKAYLERAIINKTYNFDGPVELAMRQLVTEQLSRVLPNVELGELHNFPETVQAQVTYKDLLTVFMAFSKATGVLCRLRPAVDRRVFVFETFKGTDRSIEQNETPRVSFSDIEENLTKPVFSQNTKKYKNFALVGGEGEGDARVVVEVDRTNGEPRREVFVDAKDLRSQGLSTAAYRQQLETRGNEKLDELIPATSFSSEIATNSQYVYRQDYQLGDVVTAHKTEWGIIVNDRVTEIEEVYDTSSGEVWEVTPTFGSPLPDKLTL